MTRYDKNRCHSFAWPCLCSVMCAFGLIGFAGCAAEKTAQQSRSAGSGGNPTFERADVNRDGKLSREEAGDYLVYLVFEARDKNHDNRLTKEEWLAGNSSQVAAFQERDDNRDDVVTLEEAIIYGRRGGGGLALVRKADKNRDAKLDRTELETYFASLGGPPQ